MHGDEAVRFVLDSWYMDDDKCILGFGMDGDEIVRNLFLILDCEKCVLGFE